MLTRQIVLTTALLSAAFVLAACSAGVSEPAATPTPTETSCIICQSSDKNAQAAPENGADAPDEAAPPADENSDAGTGYQQPAPPPPAPSRPDSTPTVPVCPVAIAGWTAGDLTLNEIPGNVNKNLGIGTEYAVTATISVSNQSDAPLKINYLNLSTTVTTSRRTFDPIMYLDGATVEAGEIKSFPVRSPLTIGVTDGESITSSNIDGAQRQGSYDLLGTFDASCQTLGFPLNYVPNN